MLRNGLAGVPKSYAQPDALEDWLQRTGQQPAAASAPEGSPEGSTKEEPEDEQPAYTHNYTTQLFLFLNNTPPRKKQVNVIENAL